jgi:nucleoside phosphorylase
VFDVGIIIALKEEFRVFYDYIKDDFKVITDDKTKARFYSCIYRTETSKPYNCLITFVGGIGEKRATLRTQRILHKYSPKLLILIGISAGISSDVQLGDIVIPTQVDSYLDNNKTTPDNSRKSFKINFGGEVYRPSSDLIRSVENIEFEHNAKYIEWQKSSAKILDDVFLSNKVDKTKYKDVIRDHPIIVEQHTASGPSLSSSEKFIEWVKGRDRKYVALDMESGGFLAAIDEEKDPVHSLIIRGISDYGDERKKLFDGFNDGAFRRYAMNNAIQLLWTLMDVNGLR